MTTVQVAPYGAWKSPISADLIAASAITLAEPMLDGDDIYWLEGRPAEGGRIVLVRCTPAGVIEDVTPAPFNVRTRVHEYGGGAYLVADGVVYFSNFADQRLYRQPRAGAPQPLTPAGALRYADAVLDRQRGRLICVREDHRGSEVVNAIVAVSLAGGDPLAPTSGDEGVPLAAGNDFYASPRLSPDGTRLAWLTWNHPNMPWDGNELWVAPVESDGRLGRAVRVAGGERESIFQPEWSPDGILTFVSDRSGWWNLYRWRGVRAEALAEMPAEFGVPQWVFRASTYAYASAGRLVCAYSTAGLWRLAQFDLASGQLRPVELPYTEIGGVRAGAGQAVFCAGSPTQSLSVVRLDLATGLPTILRSAGAANVDSRYLSVPQSIEFPTAGGRTAYALYYPPANGDYAAPAGELPPLLVKSHGGPTAWASSTLKLGLQYWTSRGFAVVDVNYGGSAGFGRDYRERLKGQWGIVDVDDCVNAARYLVERRLADPARLAISGGSAGGYTTLCALAFRDVFKAGASYYGVSDLEALARDTHKFESHYLDGLIGPYPARRDLYLERSPIHAAERLSCPTIFFQGLEDVVVPPSQTEQMVAALRAKGVPVAYLPFAGEQHGFRRAENIKRSLEAELYFYSRIFGFTPADSIEPVAIENLSD